MNQKMDADQSVKITLTSQKRIYGPPLRKRKTRKVEAAKEMRQLWKLRTYTKHYNNETR